MRQLKWIILDLFLWEEWNIVNQYVCNESGDAEN